MTGYPSFDYSGSFIIEYREIKAEDTIAGLRVSQVEGGSCEDHEGFIRSAIILYTVHSVTGVTYLYVFQLNNIEILQPLNNCNKNTELVIIGETISTWEDWREFKINEVMKQLQILNHSYDIKLMGLHICNSLKGVQAFLMTYESLWEREHCISFEHSMHLGQQIYPGWPNGENS